MFVVRFLISMMAAGILVVSASTAAIWWFADRDEPAEDDDIRVAGTVQLFDPSENPELASEIRKHDADRFTRKPDVPRARKERDVKGYVQLSFVVRPDGSVGNIRVVGAAPRGYYEDEARRIVRERNYEPAEQDGQAVATRRTDIIQFDVPENREPD